ncbi:MAG: proton-coupled thiamine transporter YuaJ [Ruminococcaceae bacterium]|nr:proton-coupled thiamine transporter YuaJ [Oscillospiraceae bacterium]
MKTQVKKEKARLRALSECAIMVALSFVLSFIKVWEMPFGGAVTLLSMLPVCVAALRHGPLWGLGAAFVYSITQALMSGAVGWGLTPTVLIVCYILDYILAFTVLGLVGFLKDKGALSSVLGVVGVCALRFLCHYLSGVTIWANSIPESFIEQFGANPYLYSLFYNGGYMLPETVFTAVGAFFVIKTLSSRKLL